MDFKEIGGLLKQEREKQGLTLDDVHYKTKISKNNLRSLENGNFEDLPHRVYTKSFIKNYALFLGLDAQELVDAFEKTISFGEDLDREKESLSEDLNSRPRKRENLWTLISVFLTVAFLLILGWLVYDVFFANSGQDKDVTKNKGSLAVNSTQNKTLAQINTGFRNGSQFRNESELLASKEREIYKNSSHMSKEYSGIEKQVSNSSRVVRSEETNASLDQKAFRNKTVGLKKLGQEKEKKKPVKETKEVLKISAFEACWLGARIDDEDKDMFLRPGESVIFKFENVLELKLGNAGGVNLVYNGHKYPLQAKSGEVRTIRFP